MGSVTVGVLSVRVVATETEAIIAVALNCSVSVVTVVILGHVAHKNVARICLIRRPTSGAVRLHGISTNITVMDAVGHVVEVLDEIDESILLVERVGHRRAGMGVRDVMATKVITTVHSIVQVLRHMIISLILWLVHGAKSMTVVRHIELLDLRDLSKHSLVSFLAGAVGTNTKEVLNFVADNGPL